MGQLTDTLRATLRDLAQSDARLYRGLQEELGDNTATTTPPVALVEGDAPASREELEGLSVAALWSLCKGKGVKGLSNGPKPKQIDALLSHPDGPPLRSSLPVKATKGTKNTAGSGKAMTKANTSDRQALERRLDRLEQLVLLIAHQVGVSPEAITQLAAPPAPPPT
ncbi:MAG: hypothetical protein ACK587_15275 [Cyanobacteriota bacterium]